jgi:hypothetical protein
MPHSPRKKRNPNGSRSQRPFASEQPPQPAETNTESLVHTEEHIGMRTPFYDDPNHAAYGWQQMGMLPDFPGLHTLVFGAQNDPPLSPGSRRGQGPLRPPPVTESQNKGEQSQTRRPEFRQFVDLPSTKQKDVSPAGNDSKVFPARLALGSTDVNRKLQTAQSRERTSTLLKLTGGIHKMEPQP